eukprot:Colp12_sorted_trinity150504_noHs@27926
MGRTLQISSVFKRAFASSATLQGRVCFVQGAGRGIGAEYTRQLLNRADTEAVIATTRNPDASAELKELKSQFGDKLTVLKVDVTNEAEIEASAEHVRKTFGKVHLLINSAAILNAPEYGAAAETALKKVTEQGVLNSFRTNALGPLLVTKALQPLLQAGAAPGVHSIVANMSARVGSISDNRLGGWHSYRASKAALNMFTRNMAIEMGRGTKKTVCVVLHPGSVDTGALVLQ